jgi:hypothetical protein
MTSRAATLAKVRLEALPLSGTKAQGWAKEQMNNDLEAGFSGCLPLLAKAAAHDLFKERMAASESQVMGTRCVFHLVARTACLWLPPGYPPVCLVGLGNPRQLAVGIHHARFHV